MVTKESRWLLRRLAGYGLLVLAVTGALLALLRLRPKQARAAQETAAPTRPPTEMAVSPRPAEPMQETEPAETEQPATETTLPAPLPEGYREEYALPPLSDGTLVLVNRDFGFDPDGVETVSINDLRSIHYGVRSTELGLRPEQLVVIDDLKPGKDMADRAGVDFIAAGWTHTVPHIIETMQRICPHYCRTVAELAALLLDETEA